MAFQKLPRHMRRRAMSHNVKRVPRRLRDAVKAEIEKTKSPNKRPSRKYRRRPSNLLSEYERRKRRIGWLETHIWHAKRFKMVEKWGYRLSLHPNDKSIRACYRAVGRHCLLQDVSYESYIEVSGPREEILAGLAHLVDTQTGLTFAAKMFADGSRQGSLILYSCDSYPLKCIGKVTFLWCPNKLQLPDKSGDEDAYHRSTLWIKCHPSFLEQALQEIKTCFPVDSSDERGNLGRNVTVQSLKDQLITFRLFGPASSQILSEVLRPAVISAISMSSDTVKITQTNELGKGTFDDSTDSTLDTTLSSVMSKSSATDSTVHEESEKGIVIPEEEVKVWWKDYYSSELSLSNHQRQSEIVSVLSSSNAPGMYPPGCVLALTARDPRLLLPPKRNKVSVYNAGKQVPSTCDFSQKMSQSPLWDKKIREQVKGEKISEQKLNELRGQQLIPGSQLDLGGAESRIPVILVNRQQTGTDLAVAPKGIPSGHSSGWDLLLPAGWAMAFWVALIYRGARPGGLREARSVALQSSQILMPYDFPDTVAGQNEILTEGESRQQQHERRPPAKRPNYVKLGFPNPFSFQFHQLFMDWNKYLLSNWDVFYYDFPLSLKQTLKEKGGQHYDFHVLRDRKILRFLSKMTTVTRNQKKKFNEKGSKGNDSNETKKPSFYQQLNNSEIGKKLLENHMFSLVPVFLHNDQRGVPSTYAHICLPSPKDLKDKKSSKTGPRESLRTDPTAAQRKAERRERLRLRRKKKRGKKVQVEVESKHDSTDGPSSSSATNVVAITDSKETVQEASTNESSINDSKEIVESDRPKQTSLVTDTDRSVLGFVRNGDFNLSIGQGCAVAFISMAALLHLLQFQRDYPNVVLVRNITSLQYRFAHMQILI